MVGAGIISDLEKRAGGSHALADAKGDVFVVWNSDVPCEPDSREVLTRVWSAQESWNRKTILAAGSTALVDSMVDGCGTLRSLLQNVDVDYNRTPQVYSVLFGAELSALPVSETRQFAYGNYVRAGIDSTQ
jgi:hypothetical protein